MSSTSFFSTSPPQHPSNSHFEVLARRRQQKKMSLTQTYYLAHTARKKLTTQAARADHDLRLLVGHANLLDTLMLELSDAEHEQESWFNQTVSGATKASRRDEAEEQDDDSIPNKHIQWAETLIEEPDWDLENISDADSDVSEDDDDEDDDDGSEYDEDDFVVNDNVNDSYYSSSSSSSPFLTTSSTSTTPPTPIPHTRDPSAVVTATIVTEQEVNDDDDDEAYGDSDSEFDEDDLEDLTGLSLTRSPSRRQQQEHCPPELAPDSSSESEDDSLPPTPTQLSYDSFDSKQPTKELALSDSDQSGLFGGHDGADQRLYVAARP